ncbi:hypothetical protein FNH04_12940 [Streptomyces phyllanthi]|uniref:DUF3558 domain-containing protein n=1 Tax=Streptomyces phyllanthi TaxID=1803180 RepID=A0A5N8W0M5_9ACTN|nr:hypothetical protein [Streptomyces phyllanthi]
MWATLGAVVASALWAGGVFVLGTDDTEADLRGYESTTDLCSSIDYSSFKKVYGEASLEPGVTSLKHEALDQASCDLGLRSTRVPSWDFSYARADLSVQMDLHKRTDPGPEFTAVWSKYHQDNDSYKVKKITGLGDEAYLVTDDYLYDGGAGAGKVIIAVRDGWMTYRMNWDSSAYSANTVLPELDDVAKWLKTDAKATLENLRSD